jgi:hypothetical protein
MKIVFVCSCIEPGRDGIGDYARELAVALIRQGHEARLLGLAERFCSAEGGGAQASGGVAVPVLRLPEGRPWPERIARARAWLDAFAPDWVSLQFVIYGYSRKGLPWRLSHRLGRALAGRRVHLMLHETWIGFSRVSPLRQRLIGLLQKNIVCGVIRGLRPAVVHTSIPLYRLMLRRAGMESRLLPIPSAIPLVPGAKAEFGPALAALGITPENRAGWRVLGIFGTLHPGHDYSAFIREQLARAAAGGRRLAVLTVGRTGTAAGKILQDMGRLADGSMLTHQFGEQPARLVSGFLQNLDFGVAAAPSPFLGKSSAVAAMRAHGLAILVPHHVRFPEFETELGSDPDHEVLERPPESFRPEAIAVALACALEAASSQPGA